MTLLSRRIDGPYNYRNASIANMDWIGFDVTVGSGFIRALSRQKTELPVMKSTSNHIVCSITQCERSTSMGTGIVDGVEMIPRAKDADAEIIHGESTRRLHRHLVYGAHIYEIVIGGISHEE